MVSVVYMVSAQGDEGVIKEQKKTFGHAFFGLVVIIMADAIINKTFYPATDTTVTTPGPQQIKNFAAEMFGMAGYFLQFLAVVCVFFLVLAGFYYIISFADDAQAAKAKLILQNLGIGFLTIVFAYTVVSAITPMLSGQVIAQ